MQEIKKDIQQVWAGTVGCYTDGYLIDEDEKEISLISLFGTPSRVTAVRASILIGDRICVEPCWNMDWQQRQWASRNKQQPFKTISRKLAPNVAHSLMYADNLKPDNQCGQIILFGKDMEEIHRKFFAAAQEQYSTPLLAEWTDWLWEEMQPENLKTLRFALGFKVFFCKEDQIENRLFEIGSPIYRAEPS